MCHCKYSANQRWEARVISLQTCHGINTATNLHCYSTVLQQQLGIYRLQCLLHASIVLIDPHVSRALQQTYQTHAILG